MLNLDSRYIAPAFAAALAGTTDKGLREYRYKGLAPIAEFDGDRNLHSPSDVACVGIAQNLAGLGVTRRNACAFVFERRTAIAGLFVLAKTDLKNDYILTLTVDRRSKRCVFVDCERSDQVKFSHEVPLTIRINVSMILRSIIARLEEFAAQQRRARPYLR